MKNVLGLIFGAFFGGLLAAANLHEYDTIHSMLRLDEFDVYGLMVSAIVLATTSLWWLEKKGVMTVLGGKLTLQQSLPKRHHVIGGALFGAGWAIAGTCPAPALVMLSSGANLGFVAIAGIFIGIYLRELQAPEDSFGDGEHHISAEELVTN
tara:strand:- start:236 stop:691 length:456 start_codon:yes stop_codon:yes gene_type:complete